MIIRNVADRLPLSPSNEGNNFFNKITLVRYIIDIDKTYDNSIRLN